MSVKRYQMQESAYGPFVSYNDFFKLENDYAALRARVAKLEEALTPSAETKAAYMGEFSMNIPEFDDDGNEYIRPTNIPWTSIKEIMKAIARRALEEK